MAPWSRKLRDHRLTPDRRACCRPTRHHATGCGPALEEQRNGEWRYLEFLQVTSLITADIFMREIPGGPEPGIGPAQLTCPNTDTDHSDQSVLVLFAPLFLEGRTPTAVAETD